MGHRIILTSSASCVAELCFGAKPQRGIGLCRALTIFAHLQHNPETLSKRESWRSQSLPEPQERLMGELLCGIKEGRQQQRLYAPLSCCACCAGHRLVPGAVRGAPAHLPERLRRGGRLLRQPQPLPQVCRAHTQTSLQDQCRAQQMSLLTSCGHLLTPDVRAGRCDASLFSVQRLGHGIAIAECHCLEVSI